jgi:outer membrane protein TolC
VAPPARHPGPPGQRRETPGRAGRRARLEALQADAALAQAEAQLAQALGRSQVAAEACAASTRPSPCRPACPRPPRPVDADAARWIQAILEHNHELGVARAESARARIGASRADAERRPDPSLGVHMMRERDGEERVLGVSLSIRSPAPAAAPTPTPPSPRCR